MGFDFTVIAPFLPSHCGFSFFFGCEVFCDEFQCLPVNDCSAVSCDSSGLARRSESTSFYSAILNKSLLISYTELDRQLRYEQWNGICPSIWKDWVFSRRGWNNHRLPKATFQSSSVLFLFSLKFQSEILSPLKISLSFSTVPFLMSWPFSVKANSRSLC